ncbi:holo-ACP synthase [Streptococcus cuniculipharyngis]|uniref:Holo-[acyl-carrier-protein] synthase n=1 Tax=Streptococcus cuniculipharyngis TaxID=1562651 RepID=A0A5C5SBJ4_9STRE|nr:holo-ACP synthase [Streptococcus cuniculipharyngis]TWS96465.1 holo-ACP synthase [Streptococcus cuniculipharyngis]
MIVGHGIDLQEISAVRDAYTKRPSFASRVLTATELAVFQELPAKRQIQYLSGRWAAKEAFAKAMGTGIGRLTFQDIEVLSNAKGAPVMTCSKFSGKIFVSISHSGNLVQASVILEEENGCK